MATNAPTKFKTIEEYLSTFPKNVKGILNQMRKVIKKEAPDATEVISYNIGAFKLNGKGLVHYAGWKEHVSMYPLPAGNVSFQKRISPYASGKSTAKFPVDEPLPLDLITEIVKFRIKDHALKSKTAQKK